MTHHRRRRFVVAGGSAVLALTLAGCLQDPDAGGGAGAGGLDGFVDNSNADADKVVTILGAFGGAEEDLFNDSLAAFEEESGIDVQYTSDNNFTTLIRQRVTSGQAPDIGLFPQPGGLLEQAEDGYIQPIDTYLDYTELDRTLVPGFLDSANLNGRIYAAPMRMAVKSLVWYPKEAYEAGGYNTEPASLAELEEVADQIEADGIAPWCMGWGSDAATGWVGTDWIEEYMLRLHGPDVYDDWIYHRIPFNDPAVVEAFEAYGELAKTEGNVYGGTTAIVNTPFGEAALPAFQEDPPLCMMERQGNFVTGFYPEEIAADLDNQVGLFVFPPAEDGFEGQPILGGGDLAALYNGNDEDSIAVMRFITSDEFGGPWAEAGGWLSPHTTFDLELYPDELTRKTAQIANEADVFRYDGSDVMPNAVGGGSFWTGMVEWMNGAKTAEEVTQDIEDSWPEDEAVATETAGS